MKEKLKLWFYSTFGKMDNPMEIDWPYFGMIILISIVFIVGLGILINY